MENLFLPGNPRYQPKKMLNIFGYDNLYKPYVLVELATMEALYENSVIPKADYQSLSEEIKKELLKIKTSEIDQIEREVTHHDIRALVQKIKSLLNKRLQRWVHIPLTSYDVIDTGRSLQFIQAYNLIRESIVKLTNQMMVKTEEFAEIPQIGRTHGQHALPITVGFWLASILNRILFNLKQMDDSAKGLVGKISGAVGAYNAQMGLNLERSGKSFEKQVLEKLGLKAAPISTQILPPEPLAYFLFSVSMMSASLAQLGRDGRNLMRTEIAELSEVFEKNQVGSSTMPHKRNPKNFENTEGMWIKTKNEFGKVMDTLISEHQRDLVGSSVSRDFPIILINLQKQLDTLLRTNKQNESFFERIEIHTKKCQENLKMSAGLVIAEPLYIALQMAGYTGDAHKLVNEDLMPFAKKTGRTLLQALNYFAQYDGDLSQVVETIPENIIQLLKEPSRYTGNASKKAREIVSMTKEYLAK
ncbi:MAG: lyase family protein [Parcubacteria group bacterium]